MMNRPRTPHLPANRRQRETRLIESLRRRGLVVGIGELVDRRRGNRWIHPRVIVEMERPA